MTPHAVLDACVLIPLPLADTLLQLAETGHHRPTWSAALLDETRRNLIGKIGLLPERAARRIDLMRRAFPWAEADPPPELIDAMTVDQKDRHVAATAVAAGATLIVTYNLKDFPDHALAPFGIRAIDPDEYLLDLLDLDPHGVVTALEQQRRRLRSPAMTADVFQQALAVNVPQFAAVVAGVAASGQQRSAPGTEVADMPMPIVARTPEEIRQAIFPAGLPDPLTPGGVIALWYAAVVRLSEPGSLTMLTRLSYDPDHWGDYSTTSAMVTGHALAQARHPDTAFPDGICYFKLIRTDVGGQMFAEHLIQDPVLWVMLVRRDLFEPWRVLAVGPQPWIDLDLADDAGGPTPLGEMP